MTDERQPEHLPARPVDVESPQHRLTVTVHGREVHFYQLSEQEMDDLAAGNASANLGIACAGLGIVVTLFVALATVPLDPRAFGAAVGTGIAGLAVTIGFGAAAARDWQRARRLVERIKAQRRQRPER